MEETGMSVAPDLVTYDVASEDIEYQRVDGEPLLLNALRPRDPRYAAATAPALAGIDAEMSYAVACWPISDPLARYHMAKTRGNERLVQAHNDYFGTEDAMREGNPQLILER